MKAFSKMPLPTAQEFKDRHDLHAGALAFLVAAVARVYAGFGWFQSGALGLAAGVSAVKYMDERGHAAPWSTEPST